MKKLKWIIPLCIVILIAAFIGILALRYRASGAVLHNPTHFLKKFFRFLMNQVCIRQLPPCQQFPLDPSHDGLVIRVRHDRNSIFPAQRKQCTFIFASLFIHSHKAGLCPCDEV